MKGLTIRVDAALSSSWYSAAGCKAQLIVQGVGMSSFLETNTGPGQRTLSGFLQLGDSDPAYRAEADLQGWKQTFLDAQTRQEVAK